LDLTVIDATGARTEQVSLPDNVAASRIVGRLVELMGLPAAGPDGRPLVYRFQHEASGRQIGDEQSLAGAGVRNDDVLRLVTLPPAPPWPRQPPSALPAQPQQPPRPPQPPPPPPAQQPPAFGRWSPSLTLAIVALAVAVGAAVTAIVLSGGGKSNPGPIVNANTTLTATTSTSTTFSSEGETETEDSATAATSTTSNGALPAVSTEQMQSEIQHMLLEWHEDVVRGDYRAAWNLLSHRKQAQQSSEYGYATWAKNQSTLRPYLNPAGLQVTVQSTEPAEGVAQVDLTGMSWDKPGAHCSEWSGITWVKYEEGSWRYDPGYSTTQQRESEWKSHFSELLGGKC
jgi:hypothetical protein